MTSTLITESLTILHLFFQHLCLKFQARRFSVLSFPDFASFASFYWRQGHKILELPWKTRSCQIFSILFELWQYWSSNWQIPWHPRSSDFHQRDAALRHSSNQFVLGWLVFICFWRTLLIFRLLFLSIFLCILDSITLIRKNRLKYQDAPVAAWKAGKQKLCVSVNLFTWFVMLFSLIYRWG